VKTYFQDSDYDDSYGLPEYFFNLIYNTVVPSACLLLWFDSNNLVVKWSFMLFFIVLAVSQFRVRIR